MQTRLVTAGVVAAVLLLGACRASPLVPTGDRGDMAVRDFAVDAGADAALDASCPAMTREICANGCDDDRNGYTDEDDPACSTQFIPTFNTRARPLYRFLVEPHRAVVLDGNEVDPSSHALYLARFTPGFAWMVRDSATNKLFRIALADGGTPGTVTEFDTAPNQSRDVCIFNGELIVVDAPRGVLVRFRSDGSRIADGGVALDPFLSACSSDGTYLYVAQHLGRGDAGMPSQFLVLDTQFQQVGVVQLPPDIAVDFDRCIDFAWSEREKRFYGLFVRSDGRDNDSLLNAHQIVPFALDGGIGPPIDAGEVHGIGEFILGSE